MVTDLPAPRRFRLYATTRVPPIEFEATTPAALMTAALEAREQLRQHSWVVLQVWSEPTGGWCDPSYQNEPRQYAVRAAAVPYLRLWEDIWRWCEDALILAGLGPSTRFS